MIRDAGTTQVWRGVAGGMQTRIFAGDGLNVLAGERVRLAAGPYTYVLFDDAELDVPGPETIMYETPGSREGACPHAPVLFDDAELDVSDPETVTYEKPGPREGACPHAPVLFDDAELYVPDAETVTYEYNTANEPEHSRSECGARQAFSTENAERVGSARATYLGSTRMGSKDYLPYGGVRTSLSHSPRGKHSFPFNWVFNCNLGTREHINGACQPLCHPLCGDAIGQACMLGSHVRQHDACSAPEKSAHIIAGKGESGIDRTNTYRANIHARGKL